MDVRYYFKTTKIRKSGRSQIVYLESDWGLKGGETVNVTAIKADMSESPVYFTKKIVCVGTSVGIFLNKDYGFQIGELISFVVEKRENNGKPYEMTARSIFRIDI